MGFGPHSVLMEHPSSRCFTEYLLAEFVPGKLGFFGCLAFFGGGGGLSLFSPLFSISLTVRHQGQMIVRVPLGPSVLNRCLGRVGFRQDG